MWFDYANWNYDSEETNGYFNTRDYKEYICVGGEHVNLPEPYGPCGTRFPTHWLWTDDDEILDEFEIEIETVTLE
jgi:hypothetical protein